MLSNETKLMIGQRQEADKSIEENHSTDLQRIRIADSGVLGGVGFNPVLSRS